MHSDFEHHYAVFADTQRRYDCTFERSLQPLLPPPQAQLWFLCIMFIAAFACSVFLLARDKNVLRFTSKDLLCGLLIGVMNAVSNLFMLKCLDVISVNSVMLSVPASNMLIAALIGQFFFKEKLNIHTWIALVRRCGARYHPGQGCTAPFQHSAH